MIQYLNGVKQETAIGSKASRKAAREKVKAAIKKAVPVVVKVSAAPVRVAFLSLVDVNFLEMARKFFLAQKAGHGDKVQKFWEKLGGNMNKLQNSINSGVKVYNATHPHKKLSGPVGKPHSPNLVNNYGHPVTNQTYNTSKRSKIGAVVTAAAAVPVATPAIAAATALFAGIGGSIAAITPLVSDAIKAKEGAKKFIDNLKPKPGTSSTPAAPEQGTPDQGDNTSEPTSSFWENNKKTILWIGGTAVGLFLVYKGYKYIKNKN